MTDKKQFLSFEVDKDLLAKIDNFRFKHRFESRAAAIRHLLEVALEKEESK